MCMAVQVQILAQEFLKRTLLNCKCCNKLARKRSARSGSSMNFCVLSHVKTKCVHACVPVAASSIMMVQKNYYCLSTSLAVFLVRSALSLSLSLSLSLRCAKPIDLIVT